MHKAPKPEKSYGSALPTRDLFSKGTRTAKQKQAKQLPWTPCAWSPMQGTGQLMKLVPFYTALSMV